MRFVPWGRADKGPPTWLSRLRRSRSGLTKKPPYWAVFLVFCRATRNPVKMLRIYGTGPARMHGIQAGHVGPYCRGAGNPATIRFADQRGTVEPSICRATRNRTGTLPTPRAWTTTIRWPAMKNTPLHNTVCFS